MKLISLVLFILFSSSLSFANVSSKLNSISLGVIYVDDIEKASNFYNKYFGFKTKFTFDHDSAALSSNGSVDFVLRGGYKKVIGAENSAHVTIMFNVGSVGKLYQELQADNIRIVQERPLEIQQGLYWLQCEDPAGNIVEVLGEE